MTEASRIAELLGDIQDELTIVADGVHSRDDFATQAELRQIAGRIHSLHVQLCDMPATQLAGGHPKCDETITAQGEMLKRAYFQLDRHLANHMAYGHDSSCGVELCALRAELELMPGVTG